MEPILAGAAVLVAATHRAILLTGSERCSRQLDTNLERHATAFQIADRAIVENAPNFHEATFRDILKIRKEYGEELAAFRAELRRMAIEASSPIASETNTIAAMDAVAKNITPVVIEMNRKIKLSRSKWAKRALETVPLLNAISRKTASCRALLLILTTGQ